MIDSVTGTTTDAATYMKQTGGLNKDDFMKLFITQLQQQDPLKPQDSSQFIAQLAQLTQVEQSYNTNSNLESLLSAINGNTNLSALSFIGKEVTAPSYQVALGAGGATIGFDLSLAADKVQLSLSNGAGVTVKTLTVGSRAAGEGSVVWDGTDNLGQRLPAGIYTVTASAQDKQGGSLSITPMLRGTVDGLESTSGTMKLSVGGVALSLADVVAVREVP
ncbi:MAG TPA: flagellar hook capping FlgD N-terminal domain-containing protein [Geobacterales bacterium]|nr:flagellar hook capping FlgD N-terminal domain-containing protein [Geobacterales bacterium]